MSKARRTKKRPEWTKDPRAAALIEQLKPAFGNMKHVRAGECWGLLQPLYARRVKGEKTLDQIAALEDEIKKLLQ